MITHVLAGVSVQDKSRLRRILEDALMDAEESLSQTVRRFAQYWLTGTTASVCALRPERNPRLVSYLDLYYTKYAQNGNGTAFGHVDFNRTKFIFGVLL